MSIEPQCNGNDRILVPQSFVDTSFFRLSYKSRGFEASLIIRQFTNYFIILFLSLEMAPTLVIMELHTIVFKAS
jgi:hypothetical protein